jgi:hypothetical protein
MDVKSDNININISAEGIPLSEPKKVTKKGNKIPKLVIEDDIDEENGTNGENTNIIVNKGTGAGGANTNYYGKKFEEKTDNENRLIEKGYLKINISKNKCGYYLSKNIGEKNIIYVSQGGLKEYIKNKYNIELFRCPDEAYIIETPNCKPQIIILEKKNQNGSGSVDTKLLAGPIFREEYEEALEYKFEVHYGFCVSKYLKDNIVSNTKKSQIFNNLMKRHNIALLFGDDDNYFETLDNWLNKFIS